MTQKLDASHICLIRGWQTFRKMRESETEIEKYLIGIVQEAKEKLTARYGESIEIDDKSEKGHYFDVFPKELSNSKNSKHPASEVFRLGAEGICLEELAKDSSDTYFRAYAYSPLKMEGTNSTVLAEVRRLFADYMPVGFKISSESDYYCTKTLSPVTPEQIADRKLLVSLLVEPLIALMDWSKKNATSLTKLAAKVRR
jgi:hypothetical protein